MEPQKPFVPCLAIDAIQDGQQHVQIKDWPELSDFYSLLQASMFNGTIAAILWFLVLDAIQDCWQHV